MQADKLTDLRFVRTDERIRNEFLRLMEEIGFQKVSVRVLVDRAEINRSTFYLHYADKFELLDTIEGELFAGLRGTVPILPVAQLLAERESITKAMLQAATYIHENGRLFMLMAGEKGDPAFLHKYAEAMRPVLFRSDSSDGFTVPQNYALAALTGMMSSLFNEWLGRGLRETPEEYVNIVSQIVRNIPTNILSLSSGSRLA